MNWSDCTCLNGAFQLCLVPVVIVWLYVWGALLPEL